MAKHHDDELIPTRASLLSRLRNWRDEASWQNFFDVYWKLIYGVARKAGLSDDEAQEVVQETLVSVAKHLPTFRYDPSIGSFKAWLLTMTRWRILGQFRKRQHKVDPFPENTSSGTDLIQALPDPKTLDVDAAWEAEWQSNLLAAAMQNVARRIDPTRYQIFDFYVNKEWPAEKVAQNFGVDVDQVYQIKHRVTQALEAEVHRLERETT